MNINIPVGEVFEAFITWLKDSGKVFFDAVSAVLNFAIEALEHVLLIDHTEIYPAVIFVLLAAFLSYVLTRSKLGNRVVALVAVVALGLTSVEVWRYSQLEYTISEERATALSGQLDSLNGDLRTVAPDDYSFGIDAVTTSLASPGIEGTAERKLRRTQRDLRDLRPSRFDDAADDLEDILAGVEAGDLPVSEASVRKLRLAFAYYTALSVEEDLDRLSSSLAASDGTRLRRTYLNQRAYERIEARLDVLLESADPDLSAESIQTEARAIASWLRTFNPQRLEWYPAFAMMVVMVILAAVAAGRGLAIFAGVGFILVYLMGFWHATMESLALVLSATLFALIIGIPTGIAAARREWVDKTTRPILDFMQTMPAFVYLIPAVLFFGLGKVPGAMATLIFAMPPAVRLTSLGIRQVPREVVEACLAFGATPSQLLYKAQLPIARPTILAGLNQTIMLALSMVVIGGMIGAGGLGQEVLSGITQLKIGLGFESGISVVILAIYLDRVTQSLGSHSKAA